MSKTELFKPPTCAKFEPNFMRVFDIAKNLDEIDMQRGVITLKGKEIAAFRMNQVVFGVKRYGVKDAPSNAACVPILVKNPTGEYNELIGARNGLTVLLMKLFGCTINSL